MLSPITSKFQQGLKKALARTDNAKDIDESLCNLVERWHNKTQSEKLSKKERAEALSDFKDTIVSLAHKDPALMLAVFRVSDLPDTKFKLTVYDKQQILYDAVSDDNAENVAICLSAGVNPLSRPSHYNSDIQHLINNLDVWNNDHPKHTTLSLSWCAVYCSDNTFDSFINAGVKPDHNSGELMYRSLEGRNFDRYMKLISTLEDPRQFDRDILECAIKKGRTYIIEALSTRKDPVSLDDLRYAWKIAMESQDSQSLFYLKHFGHTVLALANIDGDLIKKDDFIKAVKTGETGLAKEYLKIQNLLIDLECIKAIINADRHEFFIDALTRYFKDKVCIDGVYNFRSELKECRQEFIYHKPDNITHEEWRTFLESEIGSSKIILGILIHYAAQRMSFGCVKNLSEIGAPLWEPGVSYLFCEGGEEMPFSENVGIHNFLYVRRERERYDNNPNERTIHKSSKGSSGEELYPSLKKLLNLDKTSTRLEALLMHVDILIGNLLSKYVIPHACRIKLSEDLAETSIKYIENPKNNTDFKKSLDLLERHFSGLDGISDMIKEVGITIFLPDIIKEGKLNRTNALKKAIQLASIAIINERSIEEIYILSARWHKTANKLPTECRPVISESEWKKLFNEEISLDDTWSVVSIGSQKELEDDGDALHHCVGRGTYASACLEGRVHILSFRKNGRPYATAQLEESENSLDEKLITLPNGSRLSLAQFHVAANGRVTDEEMRLWEILIELSKTGKVKLNDGPFGSSKNLNEHDVVENSIGFPIEEAKVFQERIFNWYAERVRTQSQTSTPLITKERVEFAKKYYDSFYSNVYTHQS